MKIKFSRYPEGKKRAVTFSYDDGRIHDIRVIEILNKYNLKGTFHLNSYRYTEYAKDIAPEKGGIVPPDKLKEVYAGHEISSHTFSHPDMCALNANQLRDEIIEDRKFLEEKAGYVVRGMSYPFGTYNDYVLNALKYYGIEYSRTTKATNKFAVPDDFLMWHPTCHHRNALSLVEDFDNPRWRLMSLFYIWGHSYEFAQENNWEMFEEICKAVSGREDVWYATNIEIADYVNALRALKFSADSTMVYNPSAVDVYFETQKSDNDDWNVVKVCAGEHADLSK